MDTISALESVYEQVPEGFCKGLCQEACGPLPMTVAEGRRLRRAGHPVPHEEIASARFTVTGSYSCPALVDGRCSVYELRPLICRLYGAVENMRCEHGCVPDGGFLTIAEAAAVVTDAVAGGGGLR